MTTSMSGNVGWTIPNWLKPETLKVVNDLVVQAAVDLGLEDGTKLRVDTTVVQTDIHHPTDNTLLWDVVRVVTRLVRRLGKALELRRIKGFLAELTQGGCRDMIEGAMVYWILTPATESVSAMCDSCRTLD
jgi:hypothetical protein